MEEKKLCDDWLKLIKPLFPLDAKLESKMISGDYCIVIGWTLSNDPARPHKSSRRIKVVVVAEAVSDYINKDQEARSKADIKLKKFVEEKYQYFNPDHDSPYGQPPPVEEWIITSDLLNI